MFEILSNTLESKIHKCLSLLTNITVSVTDIKEARKIERGEENNDIKAKALDQLRSMQKFRKNVNVSSNIY